MDEQKKSAFVAVVGRPSVGKSTLVNRLCGHKVAIVSPVPQTTRNAIRGIYNGDEGQLVFVDTPGRHRSEKKFNKKLSSISGRSMEEADLILYVLDASRPPAQEEEDISAELAPFAGKTVAAINKIDHGAADTAGVQRFLREHLPLREAGEDSPERCVEISALEKRGLDALLALLFRLAPQGEPFYPADFYTDQDVSFRIAEIIREKAIAGLREELPHSIYVDVADMEFRDPGARAPNTAGTDGTEGPTGDRRLWVRAFIVTERESQKGMVVGKGGSRIKGIRLAAQKDLDAIFDWKIDLDLRVKTSKDWRHNDALLKRLIDR
ncbi:MAG: GTPase Era [Spirochaetaceae bacterium]|jgi:GTP-binding protein Era|nr:GTPase Era [Spirochaetaceae bacterium]